METSSMNIGNRDLDLFYAMLQERARVIRSNGNNILNWELFRKLPSDVTINILSRLPIRSILDCKVVCKSWRDLINSPEFDNYQPDRRRCLIVFPRTRAFPTSKPAERIDPPPFKISNNPMDLVHIGLSDSVPLVRSSVNGLLLLLRRHWTEQQQQHLSLWVCNPITREYVTIPNPSVTDFQLRLPYPPQCRCSFIFGRGRGHPAAPPREYGNYNFGFGVSRKGKQFKVVWITQSECRVYTLGGATGQWRSIAISGTGHGLRYNKWNTECAFVDGNLYWLDPPEGESQTEISCFDLETEVFTYFSAPASTLPDLRYRSLSVFDGCLCLCDRYVNGIDVWLMKGRNWSKTVVIDQELGFNGCNLVTYGYLFPIKDGGNGMLLGARSEAAVFCYYSNSNSNSNSNNNGWGGLSRIKRLYPSGKHRLYGYQYPLAAIYTPSFLPLRTLFVDDDVHSF